MSIYYDVKETLSMRKITEKNAFTKELTRMHLAWLGWKLLSDSAYVNKLSLLCGEKKLVFSGEVITSDFHEIIRALDDADSFELIADYRYTSVGTELEVALSRYTGLGTKLDVAMSYCDSFAISSYLEQAEKDEVQHIFYTMYNSADCGEGAGTLSAYGEKNGRVYNGIVEDRVISEFPQTGNWYAPKETVICEPESTEGLDVNAIAKVIEELSTLSEGDHITVSEAEIAYYMNNFQPKTADDLKKFAYLAGKLKELANGECFTDAELIDLDDPHGRILKFDIQNSEEFTITLAAIK